MDVYLIRHGEAVELNKEIVEDGFRYLTREGREKAVEVAKRLKYLDTGFDCIVSSPLVRAVQTAEIFAAVLNHTTKVKTAVELIGGNTITRFKHLLQRNSHHKNIACFGHSPDVNHFATGLLKDHNVKELNLNFKTCSVCKIDYDLQSGIGKFVYFLKSDTMELVKGEK
ncbi:MAG: phosphohistidine phosphatase SixA [Ignavibacteriae bacterium]|nr:MAG: phosphohistidine phosphatase SixA [Ignavibacteriota bacterium]